MTEMDKPKILIVDDSGQVRRLVVAILGRERYHLLEAPDGEEALALTFTEAPDLVLLDCGMPRMDGLEVMGRLRAHVLTRHIPIILLTARGELEDRVRGLQAGADDYIAKPFAASELVARVEAVLRRAQGSLVTDPLTGLPANPTVREEVTRRLAAGKPFALSYLDVNVFKSYVDHYGFERASQVIQELGKVVSEVLMRHGQAEDFAGHLGGDDFLLLTDPEHAEPLCAAIITRFDNLVATFYDEGDRARGYLEGVDRYGVRRRFPPISLSAAIVDAEPGDFYDCSDLASFAARCKEDVKLTDSVPWRRFRRAAQGKPVGTP